MVSSIDNKALYFLSSGVYIVSTGHEGIFNGQIINTAMQVSGSPDICIAISLHNDNYTTELLEKSRRFSISILEESVPMTFIGTFGFRCGRETDKFSKCEFKIHGGCLPIVTQHTLSVICAEVVNVIPVHTHRIYVGRVTNAEKLKDGVPLTYRAYHEIKKGKSPANAPTNIFND
jgi:flavin reductase (DIM6/NTAB) family NADH-FMN oxidoreductase RutF